MSYGLQVYNSLGQLRLDITDRLPRYLAEVKGRAHTPFKSVGPNDAANNALNDFSFDVPISGMVAGGNYVLLFNHYVANTNFYNKWGFNDYGQDYTVDQITVLNSLFEITSLGATTQAQWNALAGTSGVVYAAGVQSWFFNQVVGTNMGDGGVRSYSRYVRYPPAISAIDGGVRVLWRVPTSWGNGGTVEALYQFVLYYTIQVYKY